MSEKISLMIVEEDPEQAQGLLAALLRDCPDREIVVARTGIKGVRRLREEHPDVVLLDCTSVGEATGVLVPWTEQRNLAVPVVILTGRNCDEVLSDIRRLGLARHIVRQGNYRGAISVAVREAIARLRGERRLREFEMRRRGRPATNAAAEPSGTLRHEINNPLTGILGNAELILQARAQLPADILQRAETIVELAVRLRRLMRTNNAPSTVLHARPAAAMAFTNSRSALRAQRSRDDENL